MPHLTDEQYCRQHCGVQQAQFMYDNKVWNVNWHATREHVENTNNHQLVTVNTNVTSRVVGQLATDVRAVVLLRVNRITQWVEPVTK